MFVLLFIHFNCAKWIADRLISWQWKTKTNDQCLRMILHSIYPRNGLLSRTTTYIRLPSNPLVEWKRVPWRAAVSIHKTKSRTRRKREEDKILGFQLLNILNGSTIYKRERETWQYWTHFDCWILSRLPVTIYTKAMELLREFMRNWTGRETNSETHSDAVLVHI